MSEYSKKFQDFIEALSKKKADPGGGSVLALNFCLGAALLEKALSFSKIETFLYEELKKEKKKILKFVDEDGKLFSEVLREKNKERRRKLLKRLENISFYLGETSFRILKMVKEKRRKIKKSIKDDFSLGVKLLVIVIKGCLRNLKANQRLFSQKTENIDKLKEYIKELKWVKF